MKKNVFILSALCLAAMTLVFSGCKKENNDPQEPAQVQTYKMSIQASKGADNQANGPRRVLSLDGNTLNATWQAGEQVSVYNATKDADLTGYLEAQSNGSSVQLEGTLSGTIEVGDKLTLKFLAPSYAEQEGTIEYISEHCDYAVAENVEVTSISGETIYTVGEAAFENQQAVVKFTLLNKADDEALSGTTQLIVKVGEDTYTVNPASATSEMFVALPGFAGQTVTLKATVGSDTYTYEKNGATFANGNFYPVTAKLTKQAPPAPEGAINGKFSVSAGKQVYFSKGNLKYTKSGKFEFMTNQYDMVETINQNVGDDYASQDVISLFGWATSNLNTPANEYYYPWETDDSDSKKYGSGITTADVNWATDYANYDWGKNMGDGWRTLTKDEWVYLFNTRTVNSGTGNGKSYTVGQSVNGTLGVVLYPDNYTGDAYTTGSDWSTFENKGCVFLPAAGYRSGTGVYYVGSYGYYWSSTSSSSVGAYNVYFGGSGVYPAEHEVRCNGNSVRLVKNVE